MNAGRSLAIATLLCSLALASGAGCARNQRLDVGYPEASVNRALLASVPSPGMRGRRLVGAAVCLAGRQHVHQLHRDYDDSICMTVKVHLTGYALAA